MVMSENTQAYSVTRKELSRRGDLLAQLSQQVEDLQEGVRLSTRRRNDAGVEPPWRDREARSTARASNGTTEFGKSADFSAMCDQAMKSQDEALDFLHGTVKSLKNMGGQISEEVDLHCTLLGELEDTTDDASARVRQQHGKLKQLSEHTPTCYLWAYIVCMSMILFVLLVFF